MTLSKIKSLRKKISSLRGQGGVAPRVLERIAKSIGRTRIKKGRGEPMYVMENRFPIGIPHHSKEIGKGLSGKILDLLEEDLDYIEGGI